MSGGSYNYFFSKEPQPEIESKILEKMGLEFLEHTEINSDQQKVLLTLGFLYAKAKSFEESYNNYKDEKEKLSELLRKIEWASSFDISWEDVKLEE